MSITGIPPWVVKKVRTCDYFDDTICPSSECFDCDSDDDESDQG
jgi:hypothetical protein